MLPPFGIRACAERASDGPRPTVRPNSLLSPSQAIPLELAANLIPVPPLGDAISFYNKVFLGCEGVKVR